MPTSLLSRISEAVEAYTGPISPDEAIQVERLIREKIAQQRRGALRTQGYCLGCQSVEIGYWPLATVHKQRGDVWLDRALKKWIQPPVVQIDWRSVKINGLNYSTVTAYLCADCRGLTDGLVEQERLRLERVERRKDGFELQIVLGNVQATPAKRFWLLLKFDHDPEGLRALSYKMFLSTTYWEIVRNYVHYKRGYRCEMCAGGQPLNVHHKTYEHHGDEHLHLNDLILLCRGCHAKFHDKLAPEGDVQ